MIKTMKKTLLLLLAVSTFITSIPITEAVVKWDVSSGEAYTGSSGGGGSTTGVERNIPLDTVEISNSNGVSVSRAYVCSYGRYVGNKTNYELRIYNQENKDIINDGFIIAEEDLPLAGTAIGVNILERNTITREIRRITVDVYETTKTFKSTYKCLYKTKKAEMLPPFKQEMIQFEPTVIKECEVTEQLTSSNIECPEPATPNCELTTAVPVFEGYSPDEYDESEYEYTLNYEYSKGVEISAPTNVSEKDQEMVDACLQKAIDRTTYISHFTSVNTSTYTVEITDSNDVNGTKAIRIGNPTVQIYDHYGNKLNCTNWKKCKMTKPKITDPISTITYDTRTMLYTYQIGKTCLDVKTAQASYKASGASCGGNEIEISNDIVDEIYGGLATSFEHWHYFIPLNAKSKHGIEIKMLKNSKVNLTTSQCLTVMKNHYKSGYTKLIKPVATGGEFIGDYSPTMKNPNDSLDYNEISRNGCSLTSTISIPVQQLFYNETSSNTLNGFNFYYKPIDVSSAETDNQIDVIFPNGVSKNWLGKITTTTLWDDWYEAQTDPTASNESKMPDLSKSYDNVTYIAQDINAKQIREYTETHPYTNWLNMNLNGTSSFIGTTEGVVTRVGDPTKNIYKLGCGPANSFEYYDEAKTIKNTLYIKGCELK